MANTPLYLRVQRVRVLRAPGRRRDAQRQRAYDAETWSGAKYHGPLPSAAACQRYVTRVCRSKWMLRHFPFVARHGITVAYNGRLRRYIANGNGNTYYIETSKAGMSKWVMLHEIAHVCCGNGFGHDRVWRAVFVALVRRFLGREKAKQLEDGYRAMKLSYRFPRTLTPAQRKAARERAWCTFRGYERTTSTEA